MPNQKAILDKVKGFRQHGARFRIVAAGRARGSCPLCGAKKRDPFDVSVDKLLWTCHNCGEKGNFSKFLGLRMVEYQHAFRGVMASVLAKDRGLVESTLHALGIGWDSTSKMYMTPLFRGNKITNIKRYSLQVHKGFSTTDGHRGYTTLGGVSDAKTIWLVEGSWDTAALWEGIESDGIIGVDGAMSGQGPEIQEYCQGKSVILGFDHDDAGLRADRKSRELLQGRCLNIKSIHWPKEYKNKYDLRDQWIECGQNPKEFRKLLDKYTKDTPRPAPKNRIVTGDKPAGSTPPVPVVPPQEELKGVGLSREKAIRGFRRWLSLPEPEVLDVMFGTVFANRLEGDPVWMFIVGPSGCGKSEILMSMNDAPYIFTTSTLTPAALMSGKNGQDGVDPSIIPKIDRHVLTVKDFTPVLSLPIVDQQLIFSVLRDAYDGRIEKYYGNAVHRLYLSTFGMLAGVTPKVEEVGPSHTIVGQRFLKFYMRESCGEVTAGGDAVDRALETLDTGTHSAMRDGLLATAMAVLDRPVLPEHRPKLPKLIQERVKRLAMWTAKLRGSVNVNEYTGVARHMPTSEFPTRLVKQLGKLAMGIAIFRGKKSVTIDEFNLIAIVARDSIPDITERVIRQMYIHHRGEWTEPGELVGWLKLNDATVNNTLDNLASLRVLENRTGERSGRAFRISPSIQRLMKPLNMYAKEGRWRRVKED